MIRRNLPLTAEDREWLMISQVEHARVSHQLAAAWSGLVPDANGATRNELLQAILHHDDGWRAWQLAPGIDPEHGRPLGFTEMPPTEAQQIWSKSIEACRAVGPLAGWVVASHFIDLQKDQDHDFAEWARWLGEQDGARVDWLADWLTSDAQNSPELADACLAMLQAFDWLSLWLCCRAPVVVDDLPAVGGPLPLLDESRGGPFVFTPADEPEPDGTWTITAEPWPFDASVVDLAVDAKRCVVGNYTVFDELPLEETTLRWRLVP